MYRQVGIRLIPNICLLIVSSTVTIAETRYRIEELPAPKNAGFTVSQVLPAAVNNLGHVYATVIGSRANGQYIARPFVFANGVWSPKPIPDNVRKSYATIFNDNGDSATMEYADAKPTTEPTSRLFKNNVDQGLLEGTFLSPIAVNNSGYFAGQYLTDFGDNRKIRSAIYKDGERIDPGTLGGDTAEAHSMNSRGQIVGSSLADSTHAYGFIWENGVMQRLTHSQLNIYSPSAISDNGWLAGGGTDLDGTPIYFTAQGDEVYKYSIDPSFSDWLDDINSNGTAISVRSKYQSGMLTEVATIFDHGRVDLLYSISNAQECGWKSLDRAGDINEAGAICGWGIRNGSVRPYVAYPVPEPACLLGNCFGLLALARLRRLTPYRTPRTKSGRGRRAGIRVHPE